MPYFYKTTDPIVLNKVTSFAQQEIEFKKQCSEFGSKFGGKGRVMYSQAYYMCVVVFDDHEGDVHWRSVIDEHGVKSPRVNPKIPKGTSAETRKQIKADHEKLLEQWRTKPVNIDRATYLKELGLKGFQLFMGIVVFHVNDTVYIASTEQLIENTSNYVKGAQEILASEYYAVAEIIRSK